MFFPKKTSSNGANSSVTIRKVIVKSKKPPTNADNTPKPRSTSSTPPAKVVKESPKQQAKSSHRRRKKTPDLAKFNKITSSDTEKEFNSSISPPPQSSNLQIHRNLLNKSAASTGTFNITHSKALISKKEYKPCFTSQPNLSYKLAFPFVDGFHEVYLAQRPKQAEEHDPIAETEIIMEMVANNFVPEQYTNEIKHPLLEDCIVRRLRRAVKNDSPEKFIASINEYNTLINKLRESGEIQQHLQKMTQLPLHVSRVLLNQVYSRIVSPKTDDLREYEAFSNNVYGELLPEFMTRIFEETNLAPDSVFIDLGSGVGNCTLQAALELGCESWGCEVMKAASSLAAKQQVELEERAKLYGIKLGTINLRSASFVHNDEIQKAVSRADVVLVNNYAFDGKLNSHLIDMFLDLKEGCRIMSLKSFVPPGHVISDHNIESPLNILAVEKKEFPSNSVSWTSTQGPYYISVVDRSQIKKYLESKARPRRRH